MYLCRMLTDTTDEKILMEALSKGDHAAYRALFMRYYPKVRYFILGLVKSEEEASDIAQEVFVKLWTHRTNFAQVKTFGSYLYAWARNATFNAIESRQTRREGPGLPPQETDPSPTPYEELVAQDIRLLADMVVDRMPPQRKIIYRLSRQEGLSNEEIASQLHITKKTVENHLNLALKELRKVLFIFIILYLC